MTVSFLVFFTILAYPEATNMIPTKRIMPDASLNMDDLGWEVMWLDGSEIR